MRFLFAIQTGRIFPIWMFPFDGLFQPYFGETLTDFGNGIACQMKSLSNLLVCPSLSLAHICFQQDMRPLDLSRSSTSLFNDLLQILFLFFGQVYMVFFVAHRLYLTIVFPFFYFTPFFIHDMTLIFNALRLMTNCLYLLNVLKIGSKITLTITQF